MRSILIVDDEEEAIDVLSDYLQDLGYQTKTALNGEDAIAFLQKEHFDLMILDLRMPQLDGEGVLQMLPSIAPDTSVIIATGYSDGGKTRTEMNEYIFDYYIEKPVDLDELEQCIERIKTKRQSKNSSSSTDPVH